MATQIVVSEPPKYSIFLTLNVKQGQEETARFLLSTLPALTRSVSFRDASAGLISVAGIGAYLWDRLFAVPRPRELHPFVELHGKTHVAPSTPGDILFHIRAEQQDMCFEMARVIMQWAGDAVTVEDEVHGFRYFDSRNLMGFVDGSENPDNFEACDSVLIGDEDPGYQGGSYIIIQKYTHDMQDWNAVSTEEQERAVGRTKMDNQELTTDQPSNSHVALTDIESEDGKDLSIIRFNLPFGRLADGTIGTHFTGYSRSAATLERMLENMFIGVPEGNHDRLLDFSTPWTGCLFFMPTEGMLTNLDQWGVAESPNGVDTGESDDEQTTSQDADDGSLGIGSLRDDA